MAILCLSENNQFLSAQAIEHSFKNIRLAEPISSMHFDD